MKPIHWIRSSTEGKIAFATWSGKNQSEGYVANGEHHHFGTLNVLQLTRTSNDREVMVKEKADSLSSLVYGKEIFPE